MVHYYRDDSFTLHTDLYQINMVETYWRDGVHDKQAVFEFISVSSRLVTDMPFLLV